MKKSREIPFPFVLEELADLHPVTKPMFGAEGVYLGEKIVFILRNKPESSPEDNGIWLATTSEHHESLGKDLPSMRSIKMFGPGPTGWQVLPLSSPTFEEEAFRACALARRNDPRIGKVPKGRKLPKAQKEKKTKKAPAKKSAKSKRKPVKKKR